MTEQESNTPNRVEFMQAIQRCAEAFHVVRAELPPKHYYSDNQENLYKASLAYLGQLPVLIDPASFQIYLACIAQGLGMGAIDAADAGRFCHIAQTAMSAWKLANLTIPAARKKEKEEQERQARAAENGTPLPPKGNHLSHAQVDMALQQALDNLPLFNVQKQHFQLLRNRGHLLPCDAELRDHPLAALHFVQLAQEIIRNEALAEAGVEPKPGPGPDQGQPEQPKQAA